MSQAEPWINLATLQNELLQFNDDLNQRPQIVVANKIDLPEAEENLKVFKKNVSLPVISISAKLGTNIEELLKEIKIIYDKKSKEK